MRLNRARQVPFSDVAILVRARSFAAAVAEELRRRGVPLGTGAGVSVMTLHEAKGLEFRVVFLLAVEEGSLPHDFALEEGPDAVEEERRLLYVGITRAREALYLMTASKRGETPASAQQVPGAWSAGANADGEGSDKVDRRRPCLNCSEDRFAISGRSDHPAPRRTRGPGRSNRFWSPPSGSLA